MDVQGVLQQQKVMLLGNKWYNCAKNLHNQQKAAHAPVDTHHYTGMYLISTLAVYSTSQK